MSLLLSVAATSMAQIEPGEGQEIPTHGPFFVNASCRDFILGARPSDQKDKSEASYDLWVQMAGERGEYRVAPAIFPGGETSNINASCYPHDGLISPDARWVALDQKYCTSYAFAYILERDEAKGLKPLPKLVSEMGWDKFKEQNPKWQKKRERMAGITSIGSSLCDLVAWKQDASGVWFSLRGGDKRGEGIYQWYFFWDAKTQEVIVPESVAKINQFANARWNSQGKTYAGAWAEAEKQHFLFLASLEWRITRPEDPLYEAEEERMLQKWHSAFVEPKIRESVAKEMGDASPASIAQWKIAKQREALFKASQRAGAVATLPPP